MRSGMQPGVHHGSNCSDYEMAAKYTKGVFMICIDLVHNFRCALVCAAGQLLPFVHDVLAQHVWHLDFQATVRTLRQS